MTPKEALKKIFKGMYNKQGFIKEFKAIEQALTELEELKRDVKRFIELTFSDDINSDDWQEYLALEDKLLKEKELEELK